MVTDSSIKKQKDIFKTANKYQTTMVLLTFFPTVLIFMSFISVVFIGNPVISNKILHTSFPNLEILVNKYSAWLIFLMCMFYLLSLVVAFVISNNMVGGIGRIISELDEIIAGRSKRTISGRPRDNMTQDLLKRVNVLVKFYVENKK